MFLFLQYFFPQPITPFQLIYHPCYLTSKTIHLLNNLYIVSLDLILLCHQSLFCELYLVLTLSLGQPMTNTVLDLTIVSSQGRLTSRLFSTLSTPVSTYPVDVLTTPVCLSSFLILFTTRSSISEATYFFLQVFLSDTWFLIRGSRMIYGSRQDPRPIYRHSFCLIRR